MAGSRQATAFLALAWNEMFDPVTPDSYQPRLSNTASLLQDLEEVAKEMSSNPQAQKYFSILQEELESVIKDEEDILVQLPYYQSLARSCSKQQWKQLLPIFPTIQRLRPDFDRKIDAALIEAAAGLPEKKEAATRALRRLATRALQSGRTAEEIRSLADLASLELSPGLFVRHLIDGVKTSETQMRCIFAVAGNVSDVKSLCRKVGFNLLPRGSLSGSEVEEFERIASIELTHAHSDHAPLYIETTITASSRRRAAKYAIRLLRNTIDIFNFYSESSAIRIGNEALVQELTGTYYLTQIGNHELRQRSPRRARALTNRTLEVVPFANLSGRIFNALEHYALAHTSSASRAKLVNLWTALECLAGESDSVISRVCDLVVPIVVWRRSDKLITYAASCIQEFRASNTATLPASLDLRPDAVSRENLLLILAKPKNDPEIVQLLAYASSHPLLLNRINTLWKTFSEPTALRSELLLSQNRVTWFLNRIYRSRNLIIHQGSDTEMLQPLLDALHYYVSITLSRILHGMQLRPELFLDETVAYWKSRYCYVIEALTWKQNPLRINDIFAAPTKRYDDRLIWPSRPAADTQNG